MRKLCASILFVVACVACGSDNKAKQVDAAIVVPDAAPDAFVPDAPPDAPSFDFSCAGSGSGSVSATITLGGVAGEADMSGGLTPVPGATATLFKRGVGGGSDTQLDQSGPTDATGAFTFAAQTTNGTALDAYVKVNRDTDRTTFVFPPKPFTADQPAIPGAMISDSQFAQVGGFLNQMDANGLFIVPVMDCQNRLVAGSTLVVLDSTGQPPAGITIFDVGQVVSQAAGTYIVANVPPGVITLSATFGSTNLSSHDIESFAGADSATQVLP